LIKQKHKRNDLRKRVKILNKSVFLYKKNR